MDIIEDKKFGLMTMVKHPVSILITTGPFVFYVILFTFVTIKRRRERNPLAVKAAKAYGKMIKQLKSIGKSNGNKTDIILDGFRDYLGDRMKLVSRAHTLSDVEGDLRAAGVGRQTLDRLQTLFERCEMERYTGAKDDNDADHLVDEAIKLLREIEKKLK
jgi:hypothetical protein